MPGSIPKYLAVTHQVPNPDYMAQFGPIEPLMPDFMSVLAKRFGASMAGFAQPNRSGALTGGQGNAIDFANAGDGKVDAPTDPSRFAYAANDPLPKLNTKRGGITPVPLGSPSGLPPAATDGDAMLHMAGAAVPFPSFPTKKNCINYCSDTAIHDKSDQQSMPFHTCLRQCLEGVPWLGRPW